MKGIKVFVIIVALLIVVVLSKNLLAEQNGAVKPLREDVVQKTQKLQMPFIANDGQTDEQVKFYANTFGGTVFITKDGEIVYSLPKIEQKAKDSNHEEREGHEEYLEGKASQEKKFLHRNIIDSLKWVSWLNETWWHGLRCERSVERQTPFVREKAEKTNTDLCTQDVAGSSASPNVERRGSSLFTCSNVD